jgi:uncharacterized protein (DUF305 family)
VKTIIIASIAITILAGCARKGNDRPASDTMSQQSGTTMNADTAQHMGTAPGHADSTGMSGGMMSGDMGKDMSSMNEMMVKALDGSDSLYDHRFIDMMIPHHEGAIMMAKDAIEKSTRPELKKLAQNIITGQQKEIDRMKQWRAKWYGENTPNGMANSEEMVRHMSMMNDMMVKDLGARDSGYEERFINTMIPHHEGAVGMAVDAIEKSTHPEIRSMAKGIIDAQKSEIAQMEEWRRQWYGH